MSSARRRGAAALLLSLSAPLAAGAQVPPARPDTAPPSPAARDTTRRPAPPDSIPGWPYLRRGVVPVKEDEVPPAPLPPGSRFTFTRDSMPWTSAQTLSDLLGSIPGVFVARAGFLGLPEYLVYGGRGALGVRVFWDGMPWEPLGGDTVYVDLSRIPLTYLRRVDVEVLPAELRVYLTSERHETLSPRSVVRVMSGDFRSASYGGLFQQRWAQGVGLDLGANFVQSEGASRSNRQAQEFDVWAKGEWLPTATSGVSYQVRRQQYDRDAVPTSGGGSQGVPDRHGARTDMLFTMFASQRPFDLGLRANAGFGASHWSNDSVLGDQHLRQAFVTLGLRQPRAAVEVVGRLADARTTSALEARAGWTPAPWVVLSADAGLQRQQSGERSRAAHVSAALVGGPFSLVGDWSFRDGVQAPAWPADTLQQTHDRSVRLGFDTAPLAGHVSLVQRDAYQPLPFGEINVLAGLAPTRAATYWVADARLQPINPLTLDGWYVTPREAGLAQAADFQPPSHARAQLTFRTKFWRTFRSGAFDLKVQFAMESWSAGGGGLGPGGVPVQLPATSYWETFLAFRIVGFTAFWDLRDALNAQKQYIPGLYYPNNAQVFGVRWEFKN